MIVSVAIGFAIGLFAAFWLGSRVAIAMNSSFVGALIGVVGLAVFWGGFAAYLLRSARAQLDQFIETELPLLIDQALRFLMQFEFVREGLN